MSAPADPLHPKNNTVLLLTPPTLSLSLASLAVSACIAHATSIHVPVNISIYSSTLHPLLFARMDGAKLTSISIADNKAFTAAGHRVPTDSYGNKVEPGGGMYGVQHSNQSRFTTIRGGEPVLWGGECLGGIGISGGTPDEDKAIAGKGIEAIEKALSASPRTRMAMPSKAKM